MARITSSKYILIAFTLLGALRGTAAIAPAPDTAATATAALVANVTAPAIEATAFAGLTPAAEADADVFPAFDFDLSGLENLHKLVARQSGGAAPVPNVGPILSGVGSIISGVGSLISAASAIQAAQRQNS